MRGCFPRLFLGLDLRHQLRFDGPNGNQPLEPEPELHCADGPAGGIG
jgi:hypothetical protein